jgi:hypothetical protein
MKLILKFEDWFIVKQELADFNRHNLCEIQRDDFRRFISSQVKEAFDKLCSICSEAIEYEIRIISKSPENMEGGTLAYFQPDLSNRERHVFACYLEYALPHYYNYRVQENAEYCCKNVWLHELIHSADYQNIITANKALRYFNEENSQDAYFGQQENKNRLRNALWLLNKYRVEGIATFVEDLFDNRHSEDEKWDNAHTDDFMNSIYYNRNWQRLQTQEDKQLSEYYNFLPYKLGKLLIFNCLYYTDEANRAVYHTVIDKINQGSLNDIQLSDFNGIDILQKLIGISLEEFIFANIQQKVQSGIQLKLDVSFVEFIKEMLYPDYQDKQYNSQIIRNILKGRKNTEADYKDLLGYLMDKEEIAENYLKFKRKPLNPTLQKLLTNTYEKWLATNDSLLEWKLTYVFDDEELFYDKIPIIGYLDDMLVLESD